MNPPNQLAKFVSAGVENNALPAAHTQNKPVGLIEISNTSDMKPLPPQQTHNNEEIS